MTGGEEEGGDRRRAPQSSAHKSDEPTNLRSAKGKGQRTSVPLILSTASRKGGGGGNLPSNCPITARCIISLAMVSFHFTTKLVSSSSFVPPPPAAAAAAAAAPPPPAPRVAC